MPNGHDKNLLRLRSVCAAHYRAFGEWPTYARMEPIILWDLMTLLGEEQFVRLAGRLRFSTRKRWGLGVGSRRGFTDIGGTQGGGDPELAEEWLAVRPLDERDH